ncbi:MAG: ABC transporter permease subunit [Gammaproteobacteria bacterium]|nr:ABC transporter permease subunit [Gammaproteobacteria bacterium]
MQMHIWQNNRMALPKMNLWDIFALLLTVTLFATIAYSTKQITAPYHPSQLLTIQLSEKYLPLYALRTVFRMLIALSISLLLTFTIGTLAAKNKHAERIILPLIDVLQSVPVLGFLSITITGFMLLFPGSLLGPECAAIFAILVSQVWNMILGFYQSLKTIPEDLKEAASIFKLSSWQKFWRIDVPFAMPSLIWNMMMSMSASWFFVVASEAISVNNQKILLPGIGSYIATALADKNRIAVGLSIFIMFIVILLYDQCIFRPLIFWSEKFKHEEDETERTQQKMPWLIALLNKTRLLKILGDYFDTFTYQFVNCKWLLKKKASQEITKAKIIFSQMLIYFWYVSIGMIVALCVYFLSQFIFQTVTLKEASHVLLLGVYTSIRVIILIFLCSLVWIPAGVWIGLRPHVAEKVQPIIQFLAAFPANLLFPIVIYFVITYHLNVNIWATPLMILGTQWYILFNVIAGTTTIPKDLKYATVNFHLSGWLKWRRFILPSIFPYFITGAITAAGGAWNASIVAEVLTWGKTTLMAQGLGAFITQVTTSGNLPRVALGISIMCLYVLFFNYIIWQPLYNMAAKRT